MSKIDPTALVAEYGSPLYVYDEEVIRSACRDFRRAFSLEGLEVLYAMKANANPAILRLMEDEGCGIDAVSFGEVYWAQQAGFSPHRISFTGNNVGRDEFQQVKDAGVHVTVDGLSQLISWSQVHPQSTLGLRINPDLGDGHHDHVITGGPHSKFGIATDDLDHVLAAADRLGLTVDSVQQHIGSGILDHQVLLKAMALLLEIARPLPDLRVVDFGGGFGIPTHPGDAPLDLYTFGEEARKLMLAFRRDVGREIQFRFEPGRWLVAAAGTLYVTVTAVKRTRHHTFVGTDSGMHHLLRPALYGSQHPVVNVTRPEAAVERFEVAGNICESGDLLAKNIPLPKPEEGDVLAIRDVGAYGFTMASHYNLRPRPAEVLITHQGPQLVRPRERVEDLFPG